MQSRDEVIGSELSDEKTASLPRVIVLAENYFQGRGGGDHVIRRMVDWLDQERVDFKVVALCSRSAQNADERRFTLYEEPKDWRIDWLRKYIDDGPASFLSTKLALSRLRCWDDAEVIWTKMERGVCLARKLAPKATIVFSPGEVYLGLRTFLRNEGLGEGRLGLLRKIFSWWWLSRAQRRAVAVADGIVTNSTHMRQQLIERYGPLKSCVPIPNPAPDVSSISREARAEARHRLRAALGIPQSAYVFVSAGRLTQRKGFDFLLQAFSELTTGQPHLMICGDGESSAQLRQMVLDLGLADRVHFPGYVAPIWDHFFASDCFVSTAVFEPFGNVLVEAMACGLPVIGLAGPEDGIETASEEIIRDGEFGYVVRGKDRMALAGRMRVMCGQGPERQASMALAAESTATSSLSPGAVLKERLQYAYSLHATRRRLVD